MNVRRKANDGDELRNYFPRNSVIVWGIVLAVVMFGAGFLSGERVGRKNSQNELQLTQALQFIPPVEEGKKVEKPAEDQIPVENIKEGESKVWDILVGEGDKSLGEGQKSEELTPAEENEPEVKVPEVKEEEKIATASPVPKPVRASAPKVAAEEASGEKYYTLQVISSRDEKKAREYAQKLEQKGLPSTRVLSAEVQGKGTWYRVRIGKFGSKAQAEAFEKEVKSKYGLKPKIILESATSSQ